MAFPACTDSALFSRQQKVGSSRKGESERTPHLQRWYREKVSLLVREALPAEGQEEISSQADALLDFKCV